MSAGRLVEMRTSSSLESDALFTPDDFEALTKIPKSWLYGRIHSKSLPFAHLKIGRYVRFRKSDIEDFLQRGEVK
jgi:excisionase family DNA binding protein